MSRSASSNSKKQASKVAVEDQKVKRIDPSSGVAEVVPLLVSSRVQTCFGHLFACVDRTGCG